MNRKVLEAIRFEELSRAEIEKATGASHSSVQTTLKEAQDLGILDIDTRRRPWLFLLKKEIDPASFEGTTLKLESTPVEEWNNFGEWIKVIRSVKWDEDKFAEPMWNNSLFVLALLAKDVSPQIRAHESEKLINAWRSRFELYTKALRIINAIADLPMRERNLANFGVSLTEGEEQALAWIFNEMKKRFLDDK